MASEASGRVVLMTASLRVLHLASFSGNIGDNANHMGFRPWFEAVIGRAIEWSDLEIREFYWREREFDDGFVALANAHDVVVIGGGNYFELWVESSPTGTSIAIDPARFARIRVPVLFNALGVDAGQGVPDASLERFRAFLGALVASPRCLVSVRNDGAIETLRTYLGERYVEGVHHVPDGGFFLPTSGATSAGLLEPGRRYVGINLACDMAEVRFGAFSAQGGRSGFVGEFAGAISMLAEAHPEVTFVFFPHIFRDLEIISEVLDALGDRLRRTRVVVAPYASGPVAAAETFEMYRRCDLVMAMRFHANVCPIGMGRQTLGLVCYRQIEKLYEELGQPDRGIDVSRPGFAETLVSSATRALTRPETFEAGPGEARAQVEAMRERFSVALRNWARSNGL